MLLTLPHLVVLAEPRHHVGLGYGQEVGLKGSLGSDSSGEGADCGGPMRDGCITVGFGYIRCQFGGMW